MLPGGGSMSRRDDAVKACEVLPRGDAREQEGGVALRQVLAALSAGLLRISEGGLAGIFEQQVRQLLSMRSVRLREIPARYQARLITPTRTAESIVVGVPTADDRAQAVLEASFEPGRRFEERDFELL